MMVAVLCFAQLYYESDKQYENYAISNTEQAEQICLINNDQKMCHALAFMYQGGMGLPKNNEKSLQFAIKGCSLGDEFCCDGIVYLTSLKANKKRLNIPITCPGGLDKDKAYEYALEFLERGNGKEAKKCLEKGCNKKYSPLAKSCTKLGDMYYDGYGVVFSYEEALKYYTKGCELGDIDACLGTKKVTQKIKYEQRLDNKNKHQIIINKQNKPQENYNIYNQGTDNIMLEKRQKFGL